MIKRLFDLIASFFGLLLVMPVISLIAFLIRLDSKGNVFYLQQRVGKNNKDFFIYKFRTMHAGSDKKGLLTVGNDSRITKIGYFLRKYKLDELPQLINVFKGDMSMVGPRPEVRKYVELYNSDQLKVLKVKPGITDYASIKYSNENEILGNADNPEELYIQEVMPEKLQLNLRYISDQSLLTDLKIIFHTLKKIAG